MSNHGRIPPALADARARTWYPLGMSTLVLALGIAMFAYILTIQLTPCGQTVAHAAQCSVGDAETFTGEINVGATPGPGNAYDLLASGGAGAPAEWGSPVIVKPATETVNTNNVLQNDDDFVFTVAANATYAVTGLLVVNSGGTPDFQFQWILPAAATIDGLVDTDLNNIGGASHMGFTEAGTTAINGQAADISHTFSATLQVAGTAGTAQLQWAQNTSNASNTSVLIGSWITLRRIG